MSNLVEGIQQQCSRVRDVLLPAYKEIGSAGQFGSLMLQAAVREGEAAIASGDIVRMVRAYKMLEECK